MYHKNGRNLSAYLHRAILRFDSGYSKKVTCFQKLLTSEVLGFSKSTLACLGSTTGNSSNKVAYPF